VTRRHCGAISCVQLVLNGRVEGTVLSGSPFRAVGGSAVFHQERQLRDGYKVHTCLSISCPPTPESLPLEDFERVAVRHGLSPIDQAKSKVQQTNLS
jgi:hypothetical protein